MGKPEEILKSSYISEKLTGDKSNLRLSSYKEVKENGKKTKYADVIKSIKHMAELIDIILDDYIESQEPKGLNESIHEIESIDKIKEAME